MQLGNEHRTGRDRVVRRELACEPDPLVIGENINRQREIRTFRRAERQIWDYAFKCAFEIKQVEISSRLRSPIRRAPDISPQQNSKMPFPVFRWREYTADFKKRNTVGSGTNVSFQYVEQTADQVWPQRDVIFAQRIAQLDRFVGRHRASRNQF